MTITLVFILGVVCGVILGASFTYGYLTDKR